MVKLQLIKPKTLPDDKFAYLEKDACVLDLGTCQVLMPSGTGMDYQPAFITIKDLFNMELEKAEGVTSGFRPRIYVPDLDWKTVPVNLVDVGVFNAVASAGDAIYWHGKLRFSKKNWSAKIAGFIYYLQFGMPKILSWAPEAGLEFCIDHNVCYYLNQMFKGVTKTKPKVLKVAWDRDNLYLQENSEDCPYVLIVPREHKEYVEKSKSFDKISEHYENSKSKTSSKKQTIDRVSFSKDKDSLVKHLLKACGDTCQFIDGVDAGDKYESDTVTLWINKKK